MADRKAGGSGLVLTEVKKCNCPNPVQDALYGAQMRLHRAVPEKIGKGYIYRCTVCSPIRARNRMALYLKGTGAVVGRLA